MAKNPWIIWQDKITKDMSSVVGERAVNLSRLKELEIKVPKFFVISVDAFKEFFTNVEGEIERELEELSDDFQSAKRVATNIKIILANQEISEAFQDELLQAYREASNSESNYEIPSKAMELIKSGRDLAPLTLQLSPMQHLINFENIQNVIGITKLVNFIRELWLRIFSAKSLYYMAKNNLTYKDFLPSIIIYKTTPPSKSGDLFSVNPLTNKNDEVYIQAIWGMIANNFNSPSKFIVNKSTKQIEESGISRQLRYFTKKSQVSEMIQQDLPPELQTKAPLATPELEKLIDIAVKVETLFKFPQHIEWSINKEAVVTGVQPITNSFRKPIHLKAEEETEAKAKGVPLVAKDFRGRVVKPSNLIPTVTGESVLVILRSDDALFEAMLGSAGVISPASGLSSHLAVNAREFNIPCVISVRDALKSFDENQEVEVRNGQVFASEPEPDPQTPSTPDFLKEIPQIAERQEPHIPEREEVTRVVEPTIDLGTPIEQVSINEMISKLTELEKHITNRVYEEAEKRKAGLEVDEQEQKKIRLMQELEWDIRNIKKKLEELRS